MRQSRHSQFFDLVINYLQQIKHYKTFLSLSVYRSITILQSLSLLKGSSSSKLDLCEWILSQIYVGIQPISGVQAHQRFFVNYRFIVCPTIFRLHTTKACTNFPNLYSSAASSTIVSISYVLDGLLQCSKQTFNQGRCLC